MKSVKTAQAKESVFQRRVLDFLKTLPNTFFYKAQAVSLGGIPDIVCGIYGRFVGMELKRSKSEKPTKLQAFTLAKIHNAKNIALVVNPENWEDTKNFLRQLSGGANVQN